ncbi:hypothetical protein [Nocardia acidivorans]|uniref:hypothetical protein n=1 Tax=Nocardia acidivorans TaxID=404580 RepID=UPI0008328FC8|nr:hypothetical protein [Nocardia acidivorans]
MADKLAKTKAFLLRANDIGTAKAIWDAYSTSGANALSEAVGALYTAIRADDPNYNPGGAPSEALTDASAKAHVSGLVKTRLMLAHLFHNSGGPTADQAMIFGSNFDGTSCFLADLIKAVQADDPAWTP